MKTTRRFLAALLAFSMSIMPLPAPVSAAEPANTVSAPASASETETEPPTDVPFTDGYTELPVGCELPLYDVSAQAYLDGKVTISPHDSAQKDSFTVLADAEHPYVRIKALAEDILMLSVRNADGTAREWYDHCGKKGELLLIKIVQNSDLDKTCTEHSGFWVRTGETRKLSFWNPQDMQDEGAEISVLYGASRIACTYDKESGFVSVTGMENGVAVMEIREKRTKKAARVRIMIGDEPRETIPAEPPAETTAVTYHSGTHLTDPTESAQTTTTVTTTTTVHYDSAPRISYTDDQPARVGSERRIHVEHPVSGKVQDAMLSTRHNNDFTWHFDPETSDIVFTPLNEGDFLLTIYASGCSLSGFLKLHVSPEELPATTAVSTHVTTVTTIVPTTADATTHTETSAALLPEFAPIITYDDAPLTVCQWTAIHVEHPISGSARDARICKYDGSALKKDELLDWYFDESTSDIMVYALTPFEATTFSITASDCTFFANLTLSAEQDRVFSTIQQPETIPLHTDASAQTSATTTTTVTTTTNVYGYTTATPATTTTDSHCTVTMLDYDKSPMHVGEVRAVRFYDPDTDTAMDCRIEKHSDNFHYSYEKGTDILYITALYPGNISASVWTGTTAFYGNLDLTVAEGKPDDASSQTFGCVDDDREVNAGDATAILKEAARIGTNAERTLKGTRRAAADVNFDGVINAKDATCVLVYAAARGNHSDMPEFPQYMAERVGEPRTGQYQVLSQTFDSVYRILPDKGGWTASDDGKQYGYKYRVFTSAAQFADFAAFLSEQGSDDFTLYDTVHLHDMAAAQYNSTWFTKHDLIAVAFREPSTDYFYRLKDITADRNNNWTAEIERLCPDAGGAAVSGNLLLIPVNKAVENAASFRISVSDNPYSAHFSVYGRQSFDVSDPNSKTQIFASSTELAVPDSTEHNWLAQYTNDATFSAEEIAGKLDISGKALLYLRTDPQPSLSYKLRVRSISRDADGNYTVTVIRFLPELCTDTEASWEFLILTDKDILNAKSIKIAYMDQKELPSVNLPDAVSWMAEIIRSQSSWMDESQTVITDAETIKTYNAFSDVSDLTGKSLIRIVKRESSGSIRPEVTNVTRDKTGSYTVHITEHCPQIQTTDLAFWLMYILVDDKALTDADQIHVVYTAVHEN